MTYREPSTFIKAAIDAGEEKVKMRALQVFLRACMAGSILSIAAVFAITLTVQTGHPIVGAAIFPIGFCMIYLLGCDLLTGVFVITPLAYLDRRPGVTIKNILSNWSIVFAGNFFGAFMVAAMTAVVFTIGFTSQPDIVGSVISQIGENRTVGYKENGLGGFLTILTRGILCNWMVSIGVIGSMISTTVSGKVIAMWMPIMLFFGMAFEHSIVNMYLFPTGLLLGGNYTISDYLLWNEIPVLAGNLIGGLLMTGLPLYFIHSRACK